MGPATMPLPLEVRRLELDLSFVLSFCLLVPDCTKVIQMCKDFLKKVLLSREVSDLHCRS